MAREPIEGVNGRLLGRGGAHRFDGDRYQERFDALEASGQHIHGEADLAASLLPESVLDAGCGTGRVAIELGRRGFHVVGVDRDPSMLAVARRLAAERAGDGSPLSLSFVEADLVGLDLGATFDLVVMAGNVPLFTDPGTEEELVKSLARHLADGARLLAGFELSGSYGLADYDLHCGRAGLVLEARYSSWDAEAYRTDSHYAVSLHRR